MLAQIQNNFMQIFLIKPSTKLTKGLHYTKTKWWPELKTEVSLNNIYWTSGQNSK